jgi:hypothetical protein
MPDQLFDFVKELNPQLSLKYNKFYIGLAKKKGTGYLIGRPHGDRVMQSNIAEPHPRAQDTNFIQERMS